MDNYSGELKNGILNGQGTMTYADGEKRVGEWVYGNFRDPKED